MLLFTFPSQSQASKIHHFTDHCPQNECSFKKTTAVYSKIISSRLFRNFETLTFFQFRLLLLLRIKRIELIKCNLGIFMLMSVKSITDILQSIIFRPIGHALLLELRVGRISKQLINSVHTFFSSFFSLQWRALYFFVPFFSPEIGFGFFKNLLEFSLFIRQFVSFLLRQNQRKNCVFCRCQNGIFANLLLNQINHETKNKWEVLGKKVAHITKHDGTSTFQFVFHSIVNSIQ